MNNPVFIAIAAWIATAGACYLLLRPVSYNMFDPVIVLCIFIAFSASLLAMLCATALIPWDKFLLFSSVLLGYLAGARTVGAWFSRERFHRELISTTSDFTRAQIKALLLTALTVTGLVATLGLMLGAEGDARQHFSKIFRPLILIQTGLFMMALVLLLSRKISTARAATWVLTLAILSVPFSGKGVFIPVLYWIGLKRFVSGRGVTLRVILISASVVIFGVGIMAVIAYRKFGASGAFALLGYRLWRSGDVYIYAYQLHGLAGLRGQYNVSFLPYMLHPITAIVGIHTYNRPLGAMLASEVTGRKLFTGPNPQLPVLLDFFFPGSPALPTLIAFAMGFLIMGIRPLSLALSSTRTRFVRLGALIAAIFAPASGFLATEQVLMHIIAIAVIIVLGTLLDLFWRKRSIPEHPDRPHFAR